MPAAVTAIMRCVMIVAVLLGGCGRLLFDGSDPASARDPELPLVLNADAGGDRTVAWRQGCTVIGIDPRASYGPAELSTCKVEWYSLDSSGNGCEGPLLECVDLPGVYTAVLTVTDVEGSVAS